MAIVVTVRTASSVLLTIQCAKRLGFSLDDIFTVLGDQALKENFDRQKVLPQIDRRLEEVEIMMQSLMKQREDLKQFKIRLQDN